MIDKIQKVDGKVESFQKSKLKNSLLRSGATPLEADQIADIVLTENEPRSTRELFDLVFNELVNQNKRYVAARYNLKRALHLLGPTGYPFEKYIGSLYSFMGFETLTNVVLKGACVDHEMDVIARDGEQLIYIECKYHQSLSAKTNVKVPLYVKARMDDLYDYQRLHEHNDTKFSYFIATNARFTTDAVDYSRCKKIRLLSWEQPEGESLPQIIDKFGLYPVTVMTSLTKNQSAKMIEEGIILVKDIARNQDRLKKLNFELDTVNAIISEAEEIIDSLPH